MIAAFLAMSGMDWRSRGFKDITSMSGLWQELPQDSLDLPGATSAWRIVCASRHPLWHFEAGGFVAWRREGFEAGCLADCFIEILLKDMKGELT